MAMSPDEIRNKTFHIARRGYERGEVHRFLDGVANELQAFNQGEITAEAVVVTAEAESVSEPEVVEATPAPAEPVVTAATPSTPSTAASRSVDDFDRVGNEISLMLRQAQESALKIRNDAEIEASTLVDQVRLDIEADRSAHEQAAQELITRTEDRAAVLRREAESYAEDTRRSADDYAGARRADADMVRKEAELAVEADRKLAADKLESASIEAEAMLNEAQERAATMIRDAEDEAADRADRRLREARETVSRLIAAEQTSRQNLEDARILIDDALAQTEVSSTDLETLAGGSVSAEDDAEWAAGDDDDTDVDGAEDTTSDSEGAGDIVDDTDIEGSGDEADAVSEDSEGDNDNDDDDDDD